MGKATILASAFWGLYDLFIFIQFHLSQRVHLGQNKLRLKVAEINVKMDSPVTRET